MAEKKKKRGFLSKLGFKSKDDKKAEAAAERAAKQQLVDCLLYTSDAAEKA